MDKLQSAKSSRRRHAAQGKIGGGRTLRDALHDFRMGGAISQQNCMQRHLQHRIADGQNVVIPKFDDVFAAEPHPVDVGSVGAFQIVHIEPVGP